jgi:antirestriction protein ArdC
MSKVYEIVTDRVVAEMAKGVIPWRQPWNVRFTRPSNFAGRRYNGMNFFLLSLFGFENPLFLTFNEIKRQGCRIVEGKEKAHMPVFFWSRIPKKDHNGDETDEKLFIFKYFRVWNVADVVSEKDGSPIMLPTWYVKQREQAKTRVHTPIEAAERIVKSYKDAPKINYGRGRACYIPSLDQCDMPNAENFVGDEEYYQTKFHEYIHSTGHTSRLNRKEVMDEIKFGSHDYSVEELVAEMGSAFLCAEARIDNTRIIENSAAYLSNWMRKLKEDPKLFAMAAARAQKAADHILGRKAEIAETED